MVALLLRRILAGYASILKPVFFVLALLAVSAALSFAVAWPLWFFATEARGAYTAFTLAALAAGALFAVFRSRARRAGARIPVRGGARRRPVAFALFSVAWVIFLAAGLYAGLLLCARGLAYLGIPFLAALVLLLGLAAWGARRRK